MDQPSPRAVDCNALGASAPFACNQHPHYTPATSPSAASTSSSCVFGDTFGSTVATRPSASMTNVARWLPQYFRPYIDFSTQTPYASATACSTSASSVKSSPYLSAKRRSLRGSSGETPRTAASAAAYSARRSRMPQACVVQPGVSALG